MGRADGSLHQVLQQPLDLLEIGHVARGAEEGLLADRVEPDDVLEASERAVRS